MRLASTPVFLLGDSAIGSPYFQSISLGLECAFFLAGHLANRDMSVAEIFDRYETFMYRQWLRVYMRTMTIKHNKDVLETVDDRSRCWRSCTSSRRSGRVDHDRRDQQDPSARPIPSGSIWPSSAAP